MVHAGPRQTPSMKASGAMASRWAAISVAGSGRPCPEAVSETPAAIVKSANTIRYLNNFFLLCSLQGSGTAEQLESFLVRRSLTTL